MRWSWLAALVIAASPLAAKANVVINEIFYHAPDDLEDLQWIELFNTADAPVDLSGWKLNPELGFEFPRGSSIAGHGFVVIARSPARFKQYYREIQPLGPLAHPLSHGKEKVELLNAAGKKIDSVKYKDHDPWPVSADGYSASLERICPDAPADSPENWAASPLPADQPRPSGTPGKPNSCYSPIPLPSITQVKGPGEDAKPDQPISISAKIADGRGVKEASLLYRVVSRGVEGAETAIAMTRSGDRFQVELPPQKSASIIRYRIKAISQSGASRLSPSENDLCPARSIFVHDPWEPIKISFGMIIHVRPANPPKPEARQQQEGPWSRLFGGGNDREAAGLQPRGRGAPPQPKPPRGSSAFVYFDPKTGKTSLFDYVNIAPRDNDRGYKVHFHKDHDLDGMSVVSIIFEGNERSLLAEHLAYDVYRRAGNPASLSQFIRLNVDGHMLGYHLMIEQPNKSFLRRNGLRDDGDLYKILWYQSGVVGQHEKKTNPTTGHDDLVKTVRSLQTLRGEAQWKYIQENFDVNEVATYFAVNMVLSHWDGYFNNYFCYHDLKGTKKWQMYPWDQDKTWGFHDGLGDYDFFYNMPLTFGMQGDRPPGDGGAFGGGMWWRPGGYFSAPLLANPQFRKVFLQRVRDILEKVYTKEVYGPVMDDLADKLKEDVGLRARLNGEKPEEGVKRLQAHLQVLRNHLLKRREFLLNQAELKALK